MAGPDNQMSLRNVSDHFQEAVKGGILVIADASDMVERRSA